MIAPLHPLTVSLAALFGLYFVAAGIGVFVADRDWDALVGEFERSPALVSITAIVTFAIGGAIVMLHNRWTDPAAVIVTLAGWVAVLEGLMMLAVPKTWLSLSRLVIRAPRAWGVFFLLLGAYLLSAVLTSPLTGIF